MKMYVVTESLHALASHSYLTLYYFPDDTAAFDSLSCCWDDEPVRALVTDAFDWVLVAPATTGVLEGNTSAMLLS